MKLLIQIPCFNEEDTLPLVLADIPSNIDGIDSIETLVVDDGSSDGTVSVAQELGVDHIVQHNVNRGLARSFRTGMDACLSVGADIIVNTDGDNQYPGSLITDLIAPILDGNADIVIGDRQTDQITADLRVSVRRVLLRGGSTVAEVPLPGVRIAGGQIGKVYRQRRSAAGDILGKVCHRHRRQRQNIADLGQHI